MAFENLEPFKDEIIALRQPGPHRKTLQEVCEILFERHQLRTTPGTLSRYLKELQTSGSPVASPEATPEQEQRLEMIGLITEVLAEVRGRSEEQRLAIEHLAGQVRVNTAALEELEREVNAAPNVADDSQAVPPHLLRRIWARALLICGLLSAAIAGGIVWWLQPG